ncbi:hypothetical protein [Candidatus Gullanella endobia]|uniref:hypothetical protein n=1 Tax=Candidatus Gullanella endobia TaxID=1070130 RepID=UPI001315191F|nr:hypothetical protein [Candidatus Gullanella endobia]
MIILLIIIVLITFTISFNFTAHNKLKDVINVPNLRKNTGNQLPKKPEERWHYIKYLENC